MFVWFIPSAHCMHCICKLFILSIFLYTETILMGLLSSPPPSTIQEVICRQRFKTHLSNTLQVQQLVCRLGEPYIYGYKLQILIHIFPLRVPQLKIRRDFQLFVFPSWKTFSLVKHLNSIQFLSCSLREDHLPYLICFNFHFSHQKNPEFSNFEDVATSDKSHSISWRGGLQKSYSRYEIQLKLLFYENISVMCYSWHIVYPRENKL